MKTLGTKLLLPLAAALLWSSCVDKRPELPRISTFNPEHFEGERALDEVRKLVALGPRDAGTEGGLRAANYLHNHLQDLGLEAEIDPFVETTPRGEVSFRNVIGKLPGTTDSILLLGSHYDTKVGIGPGFEGANDSGSSSGVLIEMARLMGAARKKDYHGPEIQLLFFDGEEAVEHYGPSDGFHGSRYHAARMAGDGSLARLRAVIVLDMIGDRDLTVTIPRNSTPALKTLVLKAAHAEGARSAFSLYPYSVGDDHEAFLKRGIPAIDLIDFLYGSAPGRNDYWHTPADTMDKLSAESLQVVGRVTLRTLNDLLLSQNP